MKYKEGDTIILPITNGFWKVLGHFILRKNLRRNNNYRIVATTNMELGIEKI